MPRDWTDDDDLDDEEGDDVEYDDDDEEDEEGDDVEQDDDDEEYDDEEGPDAAT